MFYAFVKTVAFLLKANYGKIADKRVTVINEPVDGSTDRWHRPNSLSFSNIQLISVKVITIQPPPREIRIPFTCSLRQRQKMLSKYVCTCIYVYMFVFTHMVNGLLRSRVNGECHLSLALGWLVMLAIHVKIQSFDILIILQLKVLNQYTNQ